MMTPLIRVFRLSLLMAVVCAKAMPPPPTASVSDLAADPAVLWGRLDNGLRYALRRSENPDDRVSLRLLVLAGSLQETEAERGVAHFIEHLAFNGTRLYPRKSLRAFLELHGLARGPDINAYTTTTHTVYKLELPGGDEERLGETLQVLREFADGVTFEPEEVETERGIIASERRARDTPGWRSGVAFRNFAFPDSLLGSREPIGELEVIKQVSAADLRAFYQRWYRSDNMVVVAVGNFAVASTQIKLREIFASMVRPAKPLRTERPKMPPAPREMIAGINPGDKRSGSVTVEFFSLAPQPVEADSAARRREAFIRSLAFDAFNSRLKFEQLREARRFGTMESSFDSSGHLYQLARLRLDANAAQWRSTIGRAEQELRRAFEFGFTATELSEAAADRLAQYQTAVRTAETRHSAELADGIAASIEDGWVFTTPASNWALAQQALQELTPGKCVDVFRQAWGENPPQLFVHGALPNGIGTAELVEAIRNSRFEHVLPPGEVTVGKFRYDHFGPPGAIAHRSRVADLDLDLVEFANGVKLNLKATRFEADSVNLSARFGTGAAGEPAQRPGLRLLVSQGFAALGLGKHDREALIHLATGVNATLNFNAEEMTFVAGGHSDRAGTERMFELLAAYLTDPGWRKEELPDIRNHVAYTYQQTVQDVSARLTLDRFAWLSGLDPRYSPPPIKEVCRYPLSDLRAWFEPQLKQAPLEIGVVGDFDVEQMIDLAARTVGGLPARRPQTPARAPRFGSVVSLTPFLIETKNAIGAVQAAWAGPVATDHVTQRQLELLAGVLENRLTGSLREGLGATYSPRCGVWRSELRPETAYLVAALTCEPSRAAWMAGAVRQAADDLARERIGADEFERARQPRLESAPAQLKTNAYWLNSCVDSAQSRPQRLDLARTRISDLKQITAAEVTALAAQLLPKDRASLFVATPAPPPKP